MRPMHFVDIRGTTVATRPDIVDLITCGKKHTFLKIGGSFPTVYTVPKEDLEMIVEEWTTALRAPSAATLGVLTFVGDSGASFSARSDLVERITCDCDKVRADVVIQPRIFSLLCPKDYADLVTSWERILQGK